MRGYRGLRSNGKPVAVSFALGRMTAGGFFDGGSKLLKSKTIAFG